MCTHTYMYTHIHICTHTYSHLRDLDCPYSHIPTRVWPMDGRTDRQSLLKSRRLVTCMVNSLIRFHPHFQLLGSSSSGNSPNLSNRNIPPTFNLITGPYDVPNFTHYNAGGPQAPGSHPNIRHASVPTNRAYAHLGGLNAGPAFPDSSSTGGREQRLFADSLNFILILICPPPPDPQYMHFFIQFTPALTDFKGLTNFIC